ncbi:MAG TPA: hypothetical protein VM680_14235 [Verrucomicrobiae bacterium]|nr:hypothetical protein [Verrucomicrobiae bacterium]
MRRFATVAVSFLVALPIARAVEVASKPTRNLIVTDGWVQAIKEANETVYIVGKFHRAGGWTGGAAFVHTASGDAISGFPKVDGVVSAAVSDGNGGYFIAGEFSEVGGLPRKNIAHLTRQRQVDTNWISATTKIIRKLSLKDGVLYYSGSELAASPSGSVTHVAAIQSTDGKELPFTASVPGAVNALLATDDRLIVAGRFSTLQPPHLVAFDLAGQAIAWNAQVNGEVKTVALSGDTLYIGGPFTGVKGQTRNGLAAVNIQTAELLPWNPAGPVTSVPTLAITDGALYVAGYFDQMQGQSRTNFAAFDVLSGELLPIQAEAVAYNITSMAVGPDYVAFGGNPTSGFNSTNDSVFVLIDRQTGARKRSNVIPNFGVLTAAANDSEFFIGGIFSMVRSEERFGGAAFNARTYELTEWNPRVDNNPLVIAVARDRVFIGGEFTTLGGQARKNLGAVDRLTGTAIDDWQADADLGVLELGVYQNRLYVGGLFRNIGGEARVNLAALDLQTSAVLPWNPQVNTSMVRAMAISGDTMYIGGLFRSIGGVERLRLAAFDLQTGELTSWNPGLGNGWVDDLEVVGDAIYVGGRFTTLAGNSRINAGAVNTAGLITRWKPDANNPVSDIAIAGDKAFLTGEFDQINNQPRGRAAVTDAATGALLPWDPKFEFSGLCVSVVGNQVLLGGAYYTAFDEVRLGFSGFELMPLPAPPLLPNSVHINEKGIVEFSFDATSTMTVIPQVSGDLNTWTDLPAVQVQSGWRVTLGDDTSPNRPVSFYRLKSAP